MKRKFDDVDVTELLNYVNSSDSFVEVTIKMGLNPYVGNTKRNVERLIKRNNISTEHFSTVKRLSDSKIRYDKDKLIEVVSKFKTYKDILLELDLLPIESNYKTLKKYIKLFQIDVSHITKYKVRHTKLVFDKSELEAAVLNNQSLTDILKMFNIKPIAGNYKTLKRYIDMYGIDISHYNPNIIRGKKLAKINTLNLSECLVENSTYGRGSIKKRLYDDGIKERKCELCGQTEFWNGKKMSLILDHINGVNNDNRLENLRIVCPNCNATLDTHCGKNKAYK